MSNLTPKQEAFVREYLLDLNATQAAIRAGYSEKTARSAGQRLLTNVDIQSAIQEAQESRAKRTEITADRVLQELAKIGFSNVKNIYDETGNIRPIHDMDDDVSAAISGIEIVIEKGEENKECPVYTKKIRFWDKKASLELIGKHLGMFEQKQPESPADKARAIVAAVRAIDALDDPDP